METVEELITIALSRCDINEEIFTRILYNCGRGNLDAVINDIKQIEQNSIEANHDLKDAIVKLKDMKRRENA